MKEYLEMSDALDLLQCPICGAFYVPQMTVTGRTLPHCARMPPLHNLPLNVDVVDPSLTGLFVDMEV